MAEAIIGPLVGRLHELAVGEARLLGEVENDVQKLRDRLMWLQAFILEADARRRVVTDEITKVWLMQTRDVVFDAEDALDHYYHHQHVDMKFMNRFLSRKVREILKCISILTKEVCTLHKLSKRIKSINTRLEEIIVNKDKYKMDHEETNVIAWEASKPITYTDQNLDDIQPIHSSMFEKERKKLMETLARTEEHEDCHPVTISVFGKSGAGKTTLVRSVYKEMEKRNHFEVQAMESFGPHLTADNILHQIVQQLTDDNENCPRSEYKTKLGEKLEKKKYLLVIDGEVTSTEWKHILTNLNDCKAGADKGNRIVHITRHKPQKPAGPDHVTIPLKNLEQTVTKELFLKRLGNAPEVKGEYYETHSDDIYRISDGLPLAVVLLSGVLQSKESQEEWQKVFKHLKSKKKTEWLNSILTLCFDDLPHELKPCFLYFAALATNTNIEAHNLVCMWMAEGFLRPKVGVTLEKVGNMYLDELITRNLVNPVRQEDNTNPGSKLVSVQNVVHDFLQKEAHDLSFLEVHQCDDIPTLTSARRLSLQNYTDKYAALANPLPKLRSIFSQFEQDPTRTKKKQHLKDFLSKRKENIRSHIQQLLNWSEFLRVINLQGIEIGYKLPGSISNVTHLQYLGITSCSMNKIPSSIQRLTGLQTLDVRETGVRELPSAFWWKIKTLRHVLGFALKLPKRMVSLKHIQTLNSIALDDNEKALDDTLGKMIHLENLFVWNTHQDNVASLSSALRRLEYLSTLALHGSKIPLGVFTTTSLRRVKYMVLQGELDLPYELHDVNSCLPNLVFLSLKETKVSQEFVTKLAGLPSLATLALYSSSYKDVKLSFSGGEFCQLKSIKLSVESLKTLEIKKGALENLRELDILSENYQPRIEAEDIEARERIQKVIV